MEHSQAVLIRPVEANDHEQWLQMWHDYNAFYETSASANVTAATWTRILDPSSPIKALFALDKNGNVLGFANYILHMRTWSDQLACYLEDLFVRPEARGQGAGRALIEHLIQMAKNSGWSRLYWMTRENNTTARHLYDQFCTKDDFVRYSLSFPTP